MIQVGKQTSSLWRRRRRRRRRGAHPNDTYTFYVSF
jgi:hypothetical protein